MLAWVVMHTKSEATQVLIKCCHMRSMVVSGQIKCFPSDLLQDCRSIGIGSGLGSQEPKLCRVAVWPLIS